MVRSYEADNVWYNFLSDWKCVLIEWNPYLWSVVVNPNIDEAEIFFDKWKLAEFCENSCKNKKTCTQLIKNEIINLIW